jgi:hypothetical protein
LNFELTLDARIFVAIEISRVDEVHEWDFLIATKMSGNLVKIIKNITITNVIRRDYFLNYVKSQKRNLNGTP